MVQIERVKLEMVPMERVKLEMVPTERVKLEMVPMERMQLKMIPMERMQGAKEIEKVQVVNIDLEKMNMEVDKKVLVEKMNMK